MALVLRVWQQYERLLQTKPVVTQMFTSASLWSLGDVLSQKIDGSKRLDLRRTAYTACFGGILLGTAFTSPTGHLWYGFLDRTVKRYVTTAARSPQFVMSKVLIDELCFGPLHVLSFFTFMTRVEGGSWHDVKEKIRRDFWSAYVAELAVWPAFQAINFWKVPVRHQLLAVNLMCLLDATFLCWVKSQENWTERIGLPSFRKQPVEESRI